MKTVILAGGYGTRISEESKYRPKPLVEIGEKPIIWHIMKSYYYYGIDEFIICAGYKQGMIKEWFSSYYYNNSDISFDYRNGCEDVIVHKNTVEHWRVTVVDTGIDTMTGGRLKRVREYLDEETFMLTYGDGVCDVDIKKLLDFHRSHGKRATLTAVQQDQSKGVLDIGGDNAVKSFREKNLVDKTLINAGFMVFEPAIFDYLLDDTTILERDPMQNLAEQGELMSYVHRGFWQCMDSVREKEHLEKLIKNGKAPWIKW